jgi:hypothetical protein
MTTADRIFGVFGDLGTKRPVRVIAATNITLSGLQTVNGVALSAGGNGVEPDSVLAINETDPVDNGIWWVSSSAWTRRPDFNGQRDVVKGTLIPIVEGTLYSNTIWQCTSDDPIIIGTDDLAFQQIINPDIVLDLASTASASTGAGLIGFDGDNAYAAGTIGYPLRYIFNGVHMIRNNTTSSWVVFRPNGELVDITGTTTSGLQEAITYARTNGYNLEVHGGGTSTVDYGLLYCDSGIVFPPMRNMRITFNGVHLIFNAGVGTGVGVLIDSCMMVDFSFNGEIVHLGSGVPLKFKPVLPPGVDPLLNIVDSRFDITTVVASNGASACIVFDISVNSITNSQYNFREINGSGGGTKADWGILITGADSGALAAFTGNLVTATHIHDIKRAGIQIGENATSATSYAGNIYLVSGCYTDGATAVKFDTWGSHDVVSVGAMAGTSQYNIYCHAGSRNNNITVGVAQNNTSSDFIDEGTSNRIAYNGKVYQQSIILGGGAISTIGTGAGTTLSAGQIVSGIISRSGPGAPFNDTTDTATAIIAATPGVGVGSFIRLKYFNGSTQTATILGGTGVTMGGNNIVANGATRDFIARVDSVSSPAITMMG